MYAQSCPTLFDSWTTVYQASLSMGFSREEYWSGLPFSSPENPPDPGIEPTSLVSPALAGGFFTTSTTWLSWCLRWWRIHRQCRRPGFSPWIEKLTWRKELLVTPVFEPGEFHGHGVTKSQILLSNFCFHFQCHLESPKVVLLPPNTTLLMQPMDQGVVETFTKNLHHTFYQTVKVSGESGVTLWQFWKDYNIYKIIKKLTLLGARLRPSPPMGFRRTITCTFFMIFVDLRSWMRSSKRSSAT